MVYTSCWRGYEARWQIDDEGLWLIGVDGELCVSEVSRTLRSDPRQGAAIDFVLASCPDRPRFADWINGTLTAFSGEVVGYGSPPHPNFEFTHEIQVRSGRVIAFDTYDVIEMCAREKRNAVLPMLLDDVE